MNLIVCSNIMILLKRQSMLTIPLTTATETGLQVPLTLKHMCSKDRVELIATIDWLTPFGGGSYVTAQIPTTAEAVTTVGTSINFLAEAFVTFSVYRDGILVFTTMDYRTHLYDAPIPSIMTSTTDYITIQANLRPISTSIGTPPIATTTFQCFDTDISKDDHVYTITALLGSSYRNRNANYCNWYDIHNYPTNSNKICRQLFTTDCCCFFR